jgi:putative ABC transport system ATP-binding protein
MKKAVIQLNNVWKTYKMGEVEVNALREVNLAIEQGDFVAIIGSSGSGKSTLMNLVGCLDTPSKGSVLLDGQDIAHLSESNLAQIRGRKIGFIFQQFNLIPTLSAFENVKLPLEFQDAGEKEIERKTQQLLEIVGLSNRGHHLPSQLSGGQQQRVAIARALAVNPEVILADEPTGNLDSKTGDEIIHMLKNDLWKKQKKTIIIVTHDLKVAAHANTQVKISDGMIVEINHNKRLS